MKKLLIVLAIGTFAACNSGSSTSTTDSTSTTMGDTSMSTMAPDTTTGAMADTSMHMGDSTHMDSTHK